MSDHKKGLSGNSEAGKHPHCLSRRNMLMAAGVGIAGATVAYGLDRLGVFSGQGNTLPEPPTDKMTYRVHPKSGDKISLFGFGCMRFPMLPDAESHNGPEIDEAAAFALVDYTLAHGVNYFDTAWPYHKGASEEVIGKALSRHPRESFYLASKMPGYYNPTREKAQEIFEKQLKKCQVEYFDYYLLHAIMSVEAYVKPYEEQGVLDYLLEQRAKGCIRNLGWSFHGDKETLEYLLSRDVDWDFAMVQLNYNDLLHGLVPAPFVQKVVKSPAPADWMYEKMLKSNIPLMLMEPLKGGRLARLNKKTLEVLQTERPEASAASWAFRYVGGLPNVLTILSGITYMEHLQDNLRTFSPMEPLSVREQTVLKRALDVFLAQGDIGCTTCGYCMPCPYGVDIPGVFSHYNRCLDDEQVPKGERDAAYEKDGFVFGSPVHYAAASGAMTSFMDRVFFSSYCSGRLPFRLKPGAVVVSARRAGTTAALDQLNKYLTWGEMPVISSRYWNMVHGNTPDEVNQDQEGMQVMRALGTNMAWFLKCKEAGAKAGIPLPERETRVATNFIR